MVPRSGIESQKNINKLKLDQNPLGKIPEDIITQGISAIICFLKEREASGWKVMIKKDELAPQKALYGVILNYGVQCLSQASDITGLEYKDLEKAKDLLVKKKLIRLVKSQGNRDKIYYSYEINC